MKVHVVRSSDNNGDSVAVFASRAGAVEFARGLVQVDEDTVVACASCAADLHRDNGEWVSDDDAVYRAELEPGEAFAPCSSESGQHEPELLSAALDGSLYHRDPDLSIDVYLDLDITSADPHAGQLTRGGSLYGYTDAELHDHTTWRHGRAMGEAEHLAAHRWVLSHRHPRTETGALALVTYYTHEETP